MITDAILVLGIRVSLYNAVTEEQTDTLVAYMKDFLAQ
jgi:phosphoserine aminotransferase